MKYEDLTKKYTGYAYMYAEYPNKNFWLKDFSESDLKTALKELPAYRPDAPQMLYVHTPFCPSVCFYCSCYKVGTKDYSKVKHHTDFLIKEIGLFNQFFQESSIQPNFKQVHLGGGSPTYLDNTDFKRLVSELNNLSPIKNLEEFAIEIDPRQVDPQRMLFYSDQGINRVSFGIQDFDLEVQKAVNRVQPPELVGRLLVPEIRKHFNSVSFDILYGLPKQTKESFRKTINQIIEFSPERVVLIRFNYDSQTHPNQRRINPPEMPTDLLREEIFSESSETLLKKGYIQVGMEHFVKPHDKLVDAWEKGNINWNMGGYSVGNANKIIGVGPSSSSRITDNYYSQDISDIDSYEKAVSQGRFPLLRGHKLTKDDLIRRAVTMGLRGNLCLDFGKIEKSYNINFKEYFSQEFKRLSEFVDDGIITLSDEGIKSTKEGMPFISFVCMSFDKYCQRK